MPKGACVIDRPFYCPLLFSMQGSLTFLCESCSVSFLRWGLWHWPDLPCADLKQQKKEKNVKPILGPLRPESFWRKYLGPCKYNFSKFVKDNHLGPPAPRPPLAKNTLGHSFEKFSLTNRGKSFRLWLKRSKMVPSPGVTKVASQFSVNGTKPRYFV